ncbi:MAG: CoA transferase [Rhodospirillaceae bacterium]|nr:CoA transferase [Rhodospirillaceae bacterium]MYF87127.1 CoA transferase [Rhodospirillaceae bacterium]MYH35478.1 CoA transferase [Rhodospirillaceae bacterium]MYK16389.1 CoA transferase [Rhodospirillaceae bacterium]MYK57864.1 CoA transferase [Rhodospirillaceae bacterium]
MPGVLDGIRVLDFGRYIAGPYVGALLADFGADVIRVEKRGGSEDRFVLPLTTDADGRPGEGALFLQMNRNKRSVTLDPMKPEGRAALDRLVATADVVIANLPPQTMARMGLDYDSLRAVKADIILANLSSYGKDGPWATRPGFDSVGQAMCGSIYLTGEPGRPWRAPIAFIDFGTALHAAFGVAMALIEKQRSGRGQEVVGALLATAAAFNGFLLTEQSALEPDRGPIGNRAFNSGPTDLFETRDGFIVVHTVGNPLFKRWADLMGEPEWLEDERFATDDARGDNGAVLSERMAAWCAERTRDEALEALAAAHVPAGPVLKPQEALDHPQVQALGLLHPVAWPCTDRPAMVAQAPIWLSETPALPPTGQAETGEHTDEVLGAIGYGAEELADLRAAGAI